MNPNEIIDNLIDKIVSGEHTSAQGDIESLLAQKMQDALDAKKQEVAASVYGNTEQPEEDTEEVEDTEDISNEDETTSV